VGNEKVLFFFFLGFRHDKPPVVRHPSEQLINSNKKRAKQKGYIIDELRVFGERTMQKTMPEIFSKVLRLARSSNGNETISSTYRREDH
jgi:hypothetical protein